MSARCFAQQVKRTSLFFMLPAIGFVLLFLIIPTIYSAGYLSLRDFSLIRGTNRFIGLKNYGIVVSDPRFGAVLLRTILYVAVVVFADFLYAFWAAMLVYALKGSFGKILRGIIMLPILLMPVAAAMLWRSVIYNPPYELINRVFGLAISILSDPSTALWGIILAVVWAWSPWMFIIILAGLEGLPLEPIEASRLDGANYLQRIWYVILPMLKPILFIGVMLKIIQAFKAFTFISIMTQGGPAGSSHIISTYVFHVAFNEQNYGYGSAMSIFALSLPAIITILILRYLRGVEAR